MIYKKCFLIALACILAACKDDRIEESKSKQPLQVDYVVAKISNTKNKITIPGSILPSENVDLYSEIPGRILSIHFKEGQNVGKGQLLFSLDTELQEAQLKQILSDLDFAKKDEQRKKALFEANSISLEDYELSQSKKMNLEAQANVLRVQIQKGKVRAPFAGVVGLREVSQGAFISNTTKLTSIAQNNQLKIEFAVSERYAYSIKVGDKINFRLTNNNKKYLAKIYATAPSINAQTRMLTVRALVESKDKLIPGSFVEIDYTLAEGEKSFFVPAKALVPVLEGQKIWKIKNGLATSVLVEPGLRNKEEVQIFGDINSGDTIVLSGLLGLSEGMNVSIKKK